MAAGVRQQTAGLTGRNLDQCSGSTSVAGVACAGASKCCSTTLCAEHWQWPVVKTVHRVMMRPTNPGRYDNRKDRYASSDQFYSISLITSADSDIQVLPTKYGLGISLNNTRNLLLRTDRKVRYCSMRHAFTTFRRKKSPIKRVRSRNNNKYRLLDIIPKNKAGQLFT